jgi:RimJ/RimL family protein N-acetyltransferase
MRYIGEGSTLTRDESEEQVSTFVRHWEVKGFGLWAVEEKASGAFVGFVGLARTSGPGASTRPRSAGGSTAPAGERD